MVQDVFIDISDLVHEGYPFIRIMETVKDVMIRRFSVIATLAKRIKYILEFMSKLMIREAAKTKAQSALKFDSFWIMAITVTVFSWWYKFNNFF